MSNKASALAVNTGLNAVKLLFGGWGKNARKCEYHFPVNLSPPVTPSAATQGLLCAAEFVLVNKSKEKKGRVAP